LLLEIRDIQREHLEEYRRVTQESLELSRRAVRRQEQLGRLYQRVVVVGALVLTALGVFLAWISGAFH
jgi:CHASE3 domain sensor protein